MAAGRYWLWVEGVQTLQDGLRELNAGTGVAVVGGEWTFLTCSPLAWWIASTRASLAGARPSSEVTMRVGIWARLGPKLGRDQAWALAISSAARDSGVQPASGAMPSAASEAAMPARTFCLVSGVASGGSWARPAMSAAEMRPMPAMGLGFAVPVALQGLFSNAS